MEAILNNIFDKASLGMVLCRNTKRSHINMDNEKNKKFFEASVLDLPFTILKDSTKDNIPATGYSRSHGWNVKKSITIFPLRFRKSPSSELELS